MFNSYVSMFTRPGRFPPANSYDIPLNSIKWISFSHQTAWKIPLNPKMMMVYGGFSGDFFIPGMPLINIPWALQFRSYLYYLYIVTESDIINYIKYMLDVYIYIIVLLLYYCITNVLLLYFYCIIIVLSFNKSHCIP